MFTSGTLAQIGGNLSSLGAKKLTILAFVGAIILAGVAAVGVVLNQPTSEVLYSGLNAKDLNQMRVVLADAGIPFSVNSKGDTVHVQYGSKHAARMLLAEKGLPNSTSSGYELFDNLGSMGLTSFMQEITRKRALEGEIARTIQAMKGVRAARVHIVLPDRGSFRRKERKTSASVVVRTEGEHSAALATAIRHLVASAVPRLTTGRVTVLSTDGTVLVSGGDALSAAPQNKMSLEEQVSSGLAEKVRKTLAPFLGIHNFRVSISARLNTDRRRINETKFDPESRVERSVRVSKSENSAQNKQGGKPTTVEQNVPVDDKPEGASGNQSAERGERREELTNYELNTKTTSTESVGYEIERLTVAVVVNRRTLASLAKDANGGSSDFAKHLGEIEKIASTAVGMLDKRGDQITVSAVDFMATDASLEPVQALGVMEHLYRHTGTFVNALAALVAIFLLLQFGLRPVASMMVAESPAITSEENENPQIALESRQAGAADQSGKTAEMIGAPELAVAGQGDSADVMDGPPKLEVSAEPVWKDRLEDLLDDEQRAAAVMRDWIHEEVNA